MSTSRLANAALLLIGAVAVTAIVASALWVILGSSQAVAANDGRIVFALESDAYLQPVLKSFTDDGFVRVTDASALQRQINAGTTAVVFTRASLAQTDTAMLAQLYDRGIVIVGLDVSLAEMRDAGVAVTVGRARLKRDDVPSRPILSIVACRDRSVFSDWLDAWKAQQLIDARLTQLSQLGCAAG